MITTGIPFTRNEECSCCKQNLDGYHHNWMDIWHYHRGQTFPQVCQICHWIEGMLDSEGKLRTFHDHEEYWHGRDT